MRKRVKVVRICENVILNSVLIDIIEYIHPRTRQVPIKLIDDIIYESKFVSRLEGLQLEMSVGQCTDIVNKFIMKLDIDGNKNIVKWLFKERIREILSTDEQGRYRFDSRIINLLKEIVWIFYYLTLKHKRRLILVGSEYEVLTRLQGVFSDTVIPEKQFQVNKRDYLINAVSFKDTRHGFLPYPGSIDPRDFVHLLRDNHKLSEEIGWIIVGLCDNEFNPYERYHIFKFMRNLVWEKLNTKRDIVEEIEYAFAKNDKNIWRVDSVH